jgi:hypothetical protein
MFLIAIVPYGGKSTPCLQHRICDPPYASHA